MGKNLFCIELFSIRQEKFISTMFFHKICRDINIFFVLKVTGETEPARSSPNSQVTSSSPGVGAALAALGGLGGLLGNPLQMLGSLQAFQSQPSLQQLQQLAMLQQGHVTSGNQLNPQAQFFLQNQVISITQTFLS